MPCWAVYLKHLPLKLCDQPPPSSQGKRYSEFRAFSRPFISIWQVRKGEESLYFINVFKKSFTHTHTYIYSKRHLQVTQTKKQTNIFCNMAWQVIRLSWSLDPLHIHFTVISQLPSRSTWSSSFLHAKVFHKARSIKLSAMIFTMVFHTVYWVSSPCAMEATRRKRPCILIGLGIDPTGQQCGHWTIAPDMLLLRKHCMPLCTSWSFLSTNV